MYQCMPWKLQTHEHPSLELTPSAEASGQAATVEHLSVMMSLTWLSSVVIWRLYQSSSKDGQPHPLMQLSML